MSGWSNDRERGVPSRLERGKWMLDRRLTIEYVNIANMSVHQNTAALVLVARTRATLNQFTVNEHWVGEYISRYMYPMPLKGLHCQVSELVNPDTCPRQCLHWPIVTRAHVPPVSIHSSILTSFDWFAALLCVSSTIATSAVVRSGGDRYGKV